MSAQHPSGGLTPFPLPSFMQKIPPFLVLGLLLGAAPLQAAGSSSQSALPAAPSNPAATPRTRAVLAFLGSLEARTEGRILSGQFTGFASQNGKDLPARIHELTGQWPAVVGVDYADFHKDGSDIATQAANRTALAYWRAGGLVTVSAHLYNPANPAGGGLRDKGVDLDSLLKPGTDTHKRWHRQLDEVAQGLSELRAAGVVVLWRPFHEMNGGWFWWGDKSPESFVRVWRHMHDYYSRVKQLDNLLWVYGPNHGPTADRFYPGDDVVDVTGFDAYTDHVDPDHIKGYDALAARPKPFGFAEFGPHGSQNPPGDFDYRRFLDGMRKHFPRSTYFLCWDEKWSPANNLHARELYTHPAILNRDALPKGLAGDAKH